MQAATRYKDIIKIGQSMLLTGLVARSDSASDHNASKVVSIEAEIEALAVVLCTLGTSIRRLGSMQYS